MTLLLGLNLFFRAEEVRMNTSMFFYRNSLFMLALWSIKIDRTLELVSGIPNVEPY